MWARASGVVCSRVQLGCCVVRSARVLRRAGDTSAATLATIAPQHRKAHLELTHTEPRHDSPWHAVVKEVKEITPAVLGVNLEVQHQDGTDPAGGGAKFNFHSGQWVDFCVPGIEQVGGFSLCSTPAMLPRIELAVRKAAAQPALWVHSSACTPGSLVGVRSGGSFWHSVKDDPHKHSRSVILIGGGIGMSPLMGILREWTNWRAGASLPDSDELERASMTVIQTAGDAHELAWRHETIGLQQALGPSTLGVHFAATEDSGAEGSDTASLESPFDAETLHSNRVDLTLLQAVADRAGERADDANLVLPASHAELVAATSAPLWFLCGPPQMIDEVSDQLIGKLGVHPSRVRFERWW